MIKFFVKNLIKYTALIVCVFIVVSLCACGTRTADGTTEQSAGITASPVATGDAVATENSGISGADGTADVTPPATASGESEGVADATLSQGNSSQIASAKPTQRPVSTPNPAYDEIAMTFFNGTWNSSSGTVYIFNEKERSVTLKDMQTDEVLLVGSYVATTDDFTQYDLSMTFNGVTDEFIGWKYEDTGSVALLTKGTMKNYDNIWRAD